MEIVAQPPLVVQRQGTLITAAYTPPTELTRAVEHAYRGGACGLGWRVLDPCGTQLVDRGYATSDGTLVQGDPVVAEAQETCTSFGYDEADRIQRARNRLAQVEGLAIAREFWTGELSVLAGFGNRRLTEGGSVTDLNAAGAVSPIAALALLEDGIASITGGAPGVIHGTRRAITHMIQPGEIEPSGDLLLTSFGTRVVGDPGYPGTSPTGTAPAAGTSWVYGTARPTILLGPVNVTPGDRAQALDKQLNTFTYFAERPFLTFLECGIVAVRVNLPLT